MKEVKILLTNSFARDPRVYKEAKALVESNYNVEVICWDREENLEKEEIIEGIKIKRFYLPSQYGSGIKQIKQLLKYYWKSINYLKDQKIDVIYSQDFDTLFLGWLFKILKKKYLVYEVKDLYFRGLFLGDNFLSYIIKSVGEKIEKIMLKKVDHLIVASSYFEDFYSKEVNKNDITTIWNVPEKKLFDNYESQDRKQNFVVSFIGNVRYLREMKLLIDATKSLDNFKVFIAGGGPKIEDLKEYINENDMEHVEIYGKYQYEDLPYLYSRSDCIYSVYNKDIYNVRVAIPNKLFESVFCELPIIVSDETALGDFVEQNKIGYTISGENKEELRSLLINLRNNKELIKKIKKNDKKIKDKYIWENMKQQLVNIFI